MKYKKKQFIACLLILFVATTAYGQTKKVVRQVSKPVAQKVTPKKAPASKSNTGVLMVDRKPETGIPLDDSYRTGQKEMRVASPVWRGQVFKGQPKDHFKLKQSSCTELPGDKKDKLLAVFKNAYDFKSYRIPKGKAVSSKVNNVDVSRFPSTYNGRILHSFNFYDNCTIAYYVNTSRKYQSTDYIMVVDKKNQMYILNFSAFSKAPYTNPGDEDFVIQDVSNAHLVGDILYVHHGHDTYAYSSGGKNAYISAIDLKYNKVLWTSAPLTCNSNFIIVGNTIICGYGFSAEPDYVYLVDMATGQRRQTLKVASGPSNIVKKGNQIHVLTYGEYYVFDIVN